MTGFHALIHARLAKIMPATSAEGLLAQILGELNLEEIRTARDMSAVARALMDRPGYVRYVGRAIQAQAQLLGAPRV